MNFELHFVFNVLSKKFRDIQRNKKLTATLVQWTRILYRGFSTRYIWQFFNNILRVIVIWTELEFDRSVIASEKFLYDLKDIFFYLYNYTLTINCYFDGHWIEWKCNILHDYVDSLILPLSKLSIVVRKSFPSDNGFHYPIYGDLQLFFIKPIELCSCKTLYIKVNEASENFFQLRCDEQSW